MPSNSDERLGIAGAGAIACGLAATAAANVDEVLVWARSTNSADRARVALEAACAKGGIDPSQVNIVTDLEALRHSTFVVEAVVEEHEPKAMVLGEIAGHVAGDAVLSTTTSSLSIEGLAKAVGHPERFVGFHVFNPVPRMKLVELVFPDEATPETRSRANALCRALGKTAVEVPDIPGFVVNRLLFPYLFHAVELMGETGMAPADVDTCMTLGAGLPMGPIALLDFIGLDVAEAIGDEIGCSVPERLRALIAEGALGKKAGRGFYDY